jgi:hypothetical protein
MAKYFATLPTPLQTWPRFNVAPTHTVPVVRPAASGRELVAMVIVHGSRLPRRDLIATPAE